MSGTHRPISLYLVSLNRTILQQRMYLTQIKKELLAQNAPITYFICYCTRLSIEYRIDSCLLLPQPLFNMLNDWTSKKVCRKTYASRVRLFFNYREESIIMSELSLRGNVCSVCASLGTGLPFQGLVDLTLLTVPDPCREQRNYKDPPNLPFINTLLSLQGYFSIIKQRVEVFSWAANCLVVTSLLGNLSPAVRGRAAFTVSHATAGLRSNEALRCSVMTACAHWMLVVTKVGDGERRCVNSLLQSSTPSLLTAQIYQITGWNVGQQIAFSFCLPIT